MSMDHPIPRARGLTRRRLRIGLLVLLGTGLLLALLPSLARWWQSETSVDRSQIRLGTAVQGDLVRQIAVDGRVVAASHPTLFSSAAGIVHLACRAGEKVERGQFLGRIEAPELQSRLQQEHAKRIELESEVRRQRIGAKRQRLAGEQSIGLLEVEQQAARRALERAERSVALGVLSAVEHEAARDALQIVSLRVEFARQEARLASESARFELAQRQSQLQQQELVVEEIERQVNALSILSPVAGIVARLHVEDRQAVGSSAPLFTVVDLSAFEVEIAVAQSYAQEIGPGTKVLIVIGAGSYPGQITSLSPEVDKGRVRGVVAFSGTVPSGLKQHQRVAARLILETQTDVLKVPRGPFLDSGGGRQAYVLEDGLAVRRHIEVGSQSISEVEILSGMQAGEQLIVSDTSRFDGVARILLRN